MQAEVRISAPHPPVAATAPPLAAAADRWRDVDGVRFHTSAGEGLHLNPAYGIGDVAASFYATARLPQAVSGGAGSNAQPAAGAATAWGQVGRSSHEGLRDNPAYGHGRQPQLQLQGNAAAARTSAAHSPRTSSGGLAKNPVYGYGVDRAAGGTARRLPQATSTAGGAARAAPSSRHPGHGLARARDGQAFLLQNNPAYEASA